MKFTHLRYAVILSILGLTLACMGGQTQKPAATPPPQNPTPLIPTLPPTLPPSQPSVANTTPNNFSGDSGSLPGDIMGQVNMYGMGGGGGMEGECIFTPRQTGTPEMYLYENIGVSWGDQPALGKQIPISHGDLGWCACGLGSGALGASITHPDGNTETLAVQDSSQSTPENRCADFTFPVRPGIQLGPYQVKFLQGQASLNDDFTLQMPTIPAGVWQADSAWFMNLQPGEKVRLLVFVHETRPWSFVGEQSLQADPNGMLLVQFQPGFSTDKIVIAAAIGDKTGRVVVASELVPQGEDTVVNAFFKTCQNSQPTRLSVGVLARVLQNGTLLQTGNSTQPLSAGTQVKIVDGPECTGDNSWQWNMFTSSGLSGRILETDASTYFLEPVTATGQQEYFTDNFSDKASGWEEKTWSDDNSSKSYLDGKYHIKIPPSKIMIADPYSPAGIVSDTVIAVSAEVVTKSGSGDFGVVCRYQDIDSFYGLTIAENGKYFIYKYQNSEYTELKSGNTRIWLAEYPNAAYLTAACIGNQFTFSVSDEVLAQVSDATFTSGGVGLIASTGDNGNFEAAFDDFQLWVIKR